MFYESQIVLICTYLLVFLHIFFIQHTVMVKILFTYY